MANTEGCEIAVWEIAEALNFIRMVEPEVKAEANCFLGLCGGVLRSGMSEKDLDIIIIPLNGNEVPSVGLAVEIIGRHCDGPLRKLTVSKYNGQLHTPLTFWRGYYQGKAIDICHT